MFWRCGWVSMEEHVEDGGNREDDQLLTSAATAGCPSNTALIGRADVCRGCPGRDLCLSQGGADPDQKLIDVRMKAIKKKVLVLSGKGGVGKSSVAATLSMALSLLCGDGKVGLLDLDICGPSIPKLMSVEGDTIVSTEYGWTPLKSPYYGIKVMSVGSLLQTEDMAIVWRGPRKTALIKRFVKDTFWGRLEYLIFDTPPGTSDEHLTIVKTLVNVRPDGVVLVTTPQQAAVSTIRKEINFCQKMGLKILGIVENMRGYTCPCCSEVTPVFSEGGADQLSHDYKIPILGRIPLDKKLVACCEGGRNIFDDCGSSAAAVAINEMARDLHEQLLRH